MLDRHAHKVPLPVEIGVYIPANLLRLSHLIVGELNKGRIGVYKVFNSHLRDSLA